LTDDMHGFFPPAWLLSPAAERVVGDAGFAFHERLSGTRVGDATLARRLIGFGSLSAVESSATSLHAWLQSRRRAADTRLRSTRPTTPGRPRGEPSIERFEAFCRERGR
jgi:predicted deacetylase